MLKPMPKMKTAAPMPYHSAVKSVPVLRAKPMARVKFTNGLAFAYDIRKGLPPEFSVCDVLYAEPPWRAGFAEFERRAGVAEGQTFRDLIERIGRIVSVEQQRLAIVISGPQAFPLLPRPAQRLDVKLSPFGAPVYACVYHGQLPRTFGTNLELVHWLAEHYNCIGDFCCGYGRVGRIFQQHGKRFVLSDYNAQCIGYIAESLR